LNEFAPPRQLSRSALTFELEDDIVKRFITMLSIALLMPLASTAQDKKDMPSPDSQKTGDETKGEVDLLLEKLKKEGEPVLAIAGCLEKCKDPKQLITSGVVPGQAVELPQPAYPALAARAHASGQVVVMLIVNNDGKVMAAQVMSGHPLLRTAALKAARDARFTPSLLNGKPVKVVGTIVYNFVR
jgi:TonB family protein